MAVNAFGDTIEEPAPKGARVNAFGDVIEDSGVPVRTPYTPGSVEPKSTAKKGTVLERAVMGAADLATGAGKFGSALLAPYDIGADVVQGRPLGTGHRERMSSIEQFGQEKGAGDWTSVVNQAAPEVIATGGPMAGVEQQVIKQVAQRLPNALRTAKAAGVAADVGTNAAYSAAQAVAEGQDPAEAAKMAALLSGGIRAGGKVVSAPFKKGAAQTADSNARFLQDQGYEVTPGMLYPNTWAAAGERGARSTPFVGGSVEAAEGRVGRDYISRYGQDAVNDLVRVVPGKTTSVPGRYPTPPNQGALPRATAAAADEAAGSTSREVGPSMVEPIPNRYPQPDDGVLHVDSQGNVGKLPQRDPAYDAESGLFYSTNRTRPADAANLPAVQTDTTINPNHPPSVIENPNTSVGPAGTPRPRNFVEGEGTSRYTHPEDFPSRAGKPEADTFEQTVTTERRAPKVEGEGLDLVRNVQKHIDDAYNDVVDHTYLSARNGISALLTASKDLDRISWLTGKQRKQVKGFIDERLVAGMKGMGPDAIFSGRQVKNLDTILGEQARSFAEDATTKPMADALYAIQHRLRVATEATTPAHRQALTAANEAFRKALPLISATEQSLGSTGIPSALQLRKAMEKYNMSPDAVNDAMVQVAPNAPTSSQLNRRWIGSAGLAGSVMGGPASMLGLGATALGLGGVGKAAYSPRGVKLQIAMLEAPTKVKQWLASLPYADQQKYLASFAGQSAARMSDENPPRVEVRGTSAN